MNDDRTAGYQSWMNLLFIHWRCPASQLQPLLPDELTVETFDGSAWLGLVPFQMARVRPWWSPPVPGISWFLETNVRTYVRHSNGLRGVWFFSLEANSWLAVQVANRGWSLPYFYSNLSYSKSNSTIICAGRRPDGTGQYALTAELESSAEPKPADSGSLEEFLLERYLLFAPTSSGLRTGRVHHPPYQYQPLKISDLSQDLLATNQIQLESAPVHAVFSPGVHVRVSPLRKLES